MIDIVREDLMSCDTFQWAAERLGLIFVQTHEVRELISRIRHQSASVSILSHMSDGAILSPGQIFHPRPMARDLDFEWQDVPSSVRFWFAQNCDVKDDRLIPIPIGVENDHWSRPARKKEIILTLRKLEVEKHGLIYLNVNPVTNFVRPHLYRLFSGKKWCTVEYGKHGVDFNNFAQKVWSHKFVLCPEGNGMATHRPWESLYLNSYPIVRRRCFTEAFAKHLPMVLIDNWEEVTEDFLNTKYIELSGRDWNWELLKTGYWENLMREKLNA